MWHDAVACACASVEVGVGGGLARCMFTVRAEDEGDDEGGVGAMGAILEAGDEALQLDEPEFDEEGEVNVDVKCDGVGLDLESSERDAGRMEVRAGL